MTTPYVTGTVSVTASSAVVTGTGTGWLTSGLIAGEFGVDGLSVPVLSIDSNTKITLAQPWPGATASGKAYWISYDTTPGQQTVANAQRLAEYIARLDKPALAALASLVPAADKLPYFGAGGAGALFDFTAAARALLANGVLTSSTLDGTVGRITKVGDFGLGALIRNVMTEVADLSAIQNTGFYPFAESTANSPGGFGMCLHMARYQNAEQIQIAFRPQDGNIHFRSRTTGAPGVYSPWTQIYHSGKILGTVSQVSGLPTGAIIERGSNANGEYTRFADGTQECFATLEVPYSTTFDLARTWTFPAAFANSVSPVCTPTDNWYGGAVRNYILNTRVQANSNTSCVIVASNSIGNNQSGDRVTVFAHAKGRWY